MIEKAEVSPEQSDDQRRDAGEERCERCGEWDFLSRFSGWRNEAGECEELCGRCFECACLEE